MKKRKIKYDSGFEKKLHEGPLKKWNYHGCSLSYTVEKTYNPDFVHPSDSSVLIEAKGRFRTREEAAKYVWFIKCNPDKKLIFVFSNPKVPMPGARKRKDGTKLTHAEWAESNGFEWRCYDL